MNLKKLLLALFVLVSQLFTYNAVAQKTKGYLEIRGSVKIEVQNFAVSKVKVFVNGNLEKIYDADAQGKFQFNVDLNKQIVLEIVRQGYYGKKLEFNTHVPVEDVGIWSYKFSVELLPVVDGFDASLFNKPMGKIKYIEQVGDFDYDAAYTQEMQKQIKLLMKDYERKRKETYDRLLAQADSEFGQANYDEAIELYDRAVSIDPYDQYPDEQLRKIKKILAKNQNNEANYKKNIELADNAFGTSQYTTAGNYYKRALNYKDTQYPKDQLFKIDQILADQANSSAALAAKEKAYNDAIAIADKKYGTKEYEASLAKYQEASSIKPNEQYPKDRISELQNLIAQRDKNAADKEAIEKAYKEAIAAADNQFNSKKYEDARANYVKAKEIKPSEAYPSKRINEIDNLLAANKSTDEKYNRFVGLADAAFNKQDYSSAKSNYNQALTLKPNEKYPKDRIAEIDKKLADASAQKRNYDAALAKADAAYRQQKLEEAKLSYQDALNIYPDEEYPQNRINEINKKLLAQKSAADKKAAEERAYSQAVRKGDSLFNLSMYKESKNAYNQALAVKSGESYPKGKIAEIDKLVAELAELDRKYTNYISFADNQFAEGKYEDAKGNYASASKLKPNEQYPKDKIAELNKLIADAVAERAKKEKADNQYSAFIAQADAKFKQKDYEAAKPLYQNALGVKPADQYATNRIALIDDYIAEAAQKKAAAEKQLADYKSKVAEADKAFADKKYENAIDLYTSAKAIKSDEKYPDSQIALINKTIKEDQARLDAAYNNAIKQGTDLLAQKKYEEARGQFVQAKSLKPSELLPQNKITEIDNIIAQLERQKAESERILAAYRAKVADADKAFSAKEYIDATRLYKEAKTIKADETYPDDQIAKINANIKAEKDKLDADYANAIKRGDEFIASKDYDQAKVEFTQAKALKPNEPLPQRKLTEIESLIIQANAERAKNAQLENEYKAAIASGDKAFKAKDYPTAIGHYKVAKSKKPTETYPSNQIAVCEQRIKDEKTAQAAEAERKRQEQLASAQKSFGGKDFDYSGEKRSDAFINDLAKQYPEGITTENYEKPNKKIKRVIVNHNGIAREYIEVVYSYGKYYFRNGQSISSNVFYKETRE